MPSITELRPWLRPYAQFLVDVAQYNGFRPAVTSVYRSPQRQQVLYQRYLRCQREGGSCLPAAPPGMSQHEQRLAFDLVVRQGYDSPEQAALGHLWISMGGRWSPADPVHFAVLSP